MKTTAAPAASPSLAVVEVELKQMNIEAVGLKGSLAKAESQLARAKNRLTSLTHLVTKQGDHIRSLRGADGPRVVSLPDYHEMKVKFASTRTALQDARDLIQSTEKGIVNAKQRLNILEAQIATQQALLNTWGKLLPWGKS